MDGMTWDDWWAFKVHSHLTSVLCTCVCCIVIATVIFTTICDTIIIFFHRRFSRSESCRKSACKNWQFPWYYKIPPLLHECIWKIFYFTTIFNKHNLNVDVTHTWNWNTIAKWICIYMIGFAGVNKIYPVVSSSCWKTARTMHVNVKALGLDAFSSSAKKIDLYIITRIDTLLSNSSESVFDKFHFEVINLSNVNK